MIYELINSIKIHWGRNEVSTAVQRVKLDLSDD